MSFPSDNAMEPVGLYSRAYRTHKPLMCLIFNEIRGKIISGCAL
jgi:hypothetical protein